LLLSRSHDGIRLRGARSPASLTTTPTSGDVRSDDISVVRDLHFNHALASRC